MTSDHDIELLTRLERELREAAPITIEAEIGAPDLLALLGCLQLALRHPNLSGSTAEVARTFAEYLQSRLVPLGAATREVCYRGWNPKNDRES